MCLFYLIAVLFQVVHELTDVPCRKILSRHEYGGRMCGEADRFEIAL